MKQITYTRQQAMKAKHRRETPKKERVKFEKMRLFLIPLLVLLLLKLVYLFSFMYEKPRQNVDSMINTILSSDVSAKEEPSEKAEQSETEGPKSETAPEGQKSETAPGADNATGAKSAEDMLWSAELVQAMKQREADLNIKEDALRTEEERLKELQKEIENKIESLTQLEKKIADLLASKKAIEDEKLQKLAKVFEETPPEQAGPLLSKLDVDIAAQLLMKMTGRKAGKIWGYVDPARAVVISKAIAKINPGMDMNKIAEKP